VDSTRDQVLQVGGRVSLCFRRQYYEIQWLFCIDLEIPCGLQSPLHDLCNDLLARIFVQGLEIYDLFEKMRGAEKWVQGRLRLSSCNKDDIR
jgi:hypothetical protein